MHNGKKRHNLAFYIEYHCVHLRCSNKSRLLYSMVQRMRSKLLSTHYYWGKGVTVRVPRYHGDWHETDSITWSEWDLNSVHPQVLLNGSSTGRWRRIWEENEAALASSCFDLLSAKSWLHLYKYGEIDTNRLLHASATLASPPTKKSIKLNNKQVYN